jgi:hypothetical protein
VFSFVRISSLNGAEVEGSQTPFLSRLAMAV